MTLVVLLQPSIDVSVGRTIGVVGAAATLAMASSDPLVTALALTVAVATLVLRWIGQAPGRATLAAGRVAGTGTMALVAASPLLPLTGFTTGDRPVVVAALLATGVAALLAVYPLGGWAAGIIGSLDPIDVAPWLVLLVPVVLIIAERIPGGVLGDGSPGLRARPARGRAGQRRLGRGLGGARARRATRYGRVFMADIALCIAAVEGAPVSPAVTGALIILVTHLTPRADPAAIRSCRSPLAAPRGLGAAQRRPAVADLLGPPAAPRGARGGERRVDDRRRDRDGGDLHRRGHGVLDQGSCRAPGPGWRGRLPELAAWLLVAVGIAIGLAPQSLSGFVFGQLNEMDPLGLLLEVVALAVVSRGPLPGGASPGSRTAAPGSRRGSPLDARGLAAIATAVVAAAMAPLPGTPAASLPPPGGATPNLVAAVLLVVCRRLAGGPGALVAATLRARRLRRDSRWSCWGSWPPRSRAPTSPEQAGAASNAARILAVIAVLVALPIVVKPQRGGWVRRGSGDVVAASLEVMLAIVIPPAQQWPVAPLWVVGLVAAVGGLRAAAAARTRRHPGGSTSRWSPSPGCARLPRR